MRPNRDSRPVRHTRIEVISINERVVNNNSAIMPGRMPTPSSPAAANKMSNRYAHAEEETGTDRWIVPPRIRVIGGRSPDPHWIVDGDINDFGIGGDGLFPPVARGRPGGHFLLWGLPPHPRPLRP